MYCQQSEDLNSGMFKNFLLSVVQYMKPVSEIFLSEKRKWQEPQKG
jgi:hypothetical protein